MYIVKEVAMSRYTLRSSYGNKELERYEKRRPETLSSLLSHPRFHKPAYKETYDGPEISADTFEIFDSQLEPLFKGRVDEAIAFLKTLR